MARTITVHNTGSADALNLSPALSGLPTDTTVSTTCAGSLAPAASCTVTLTPGATPTAAWGELAPAGALLEVSGDNTNTPSANIAVIGYGSVFQGGYVFAIDDSTPVGGSIGGKVAALEDEPAVVWGLNLRPVASGTLDYLTAEGGGAPDGSINSYLISSHYGDSALAVAACDQSTRGGFGNWYLPAICEMGYGHSTSPTTACGSQGSPTLPDNMQSRLVDRASTPLLTSVARFSSTLTSSTSETAVLSLYTHQPTLSGGLIGLSSSNAPARPLRCVRRFTP